MARKNKDAHPGYRDGSGFGCGAISAGFGDGTGHVFGQGASGNIVYCGIGRGIGSGRGQERGSGIGRGSGSGEGTENCTGDGYGHNG